MAKDEQYDLQYNLRWSAELRDRVERVATRENGYENTAVFIREAIREKLDNPLVDPSLKKERDIKNLIELLQDPEVRRVLHE